MSKYVIDRFEGAYAICEDESQSMIRIPKYRLPLGCKEGDMIYKDSDNMYQIDKASTKAAEKKIKEKMSRLFADQK